MHGDNTVTGLAVELQPDVTQDVQITLPARQPVPIEVTPDPTGSGFGVLRVLVHARRRQLLDTRSVFMQRDGRILATFSLPPGEATFTAPGADGSRGPAAVAVRETGDMAAVRIALKAAAR